MVYVRKTGKKRPRSTKRPNSKMVKKVVQNAIREQQEVKCKFTNFDELTVNAGGEESLVGMTHFSRGNAGDQRVGNSVKPRKLVVEGWFRPRALSDSTTDPNVAFRTGQYVRLSLLRIGEGQTQTSATNQKPTNLGTNSPKLFMGNSNLPVAESSDYSDIIRPYNWKVARPMHKGCDKEFYLSMSPYTKQTKRFKFEINFSDKDSIDWTDQTSPHIPNNGNFQLFVWSRFASDDIQIASDLEFCCDSRFYYTDS